MKINEFAGTGPLIRLILRRDRILLLIWILLIGMLAVGFASSFTKLYPTAESQKAFADQVAGSPAEVVLVGNVLAPTIGGITAWRFSIAAFIIAGLGSMLMVIRHTRTEEELGRRELLCSTSVGRYSQLTAALAVAFAADLVIAGLVSAGLIGLGLPATGSIALGLSVMAVGWLIAAAAGVAAQLTESARAAQLIVGAVMVISYMMKIAGDISENSWLSILTWLSPVGLMRHIRPYAGERWWIFALLLGAAALLVVAAYALSSRRDLGAGILPSRSGPAAASAGLRSPFALAWRLQRGWLFAWTAGLAAIGIMLGFVAKTGADQMAANPQIAELFARIGGNAGVGDVFFTIALALFAEAFAIYTILATLRLRSEEEEMRVDLLLAEPVGRLRWAIGHLAIAAIGSAVLLAVFGLSAGLTYGLSTGDVAHELPRMLAASLAYLPAVLVMAGIAMALFGWLPRFTILSWGALLVCILIDFASELQLVSQTVLDISPFMHVPKILISDGSLVPLAGLLVVAALLMAVGLIGFRRRDIS